MDFCEQLRARLSDEQADERAYMTLQEAALRSIPADDLSGRIERDVAADLIAMMTGDERKHQRALSKLLGWFCR